MSVKFFHGDINPDDIARDITAFFHRGNYRVQKFGSDSHVAVQIATHPYSKSGGNTALTIAIHKAKDGISVQLGQQAWLGIAASLGMTAISAIRNPFSLLTRIDDLAQDVESLQLAEQTWKIIAKSVRQHGAGFALSERLRRTICPYCHTANEIAAGRCIACGAPLGEAQPKTCNNCGFVVQKPEVKCPNCGAILPV